MADQRTIAKELNLSTATVCRSLKDDPAIHPDTRAKVAALAAKLGYRARGARIVRSTDTHSDLVHLGVLIVSTSSPKSKHHLVWNRVMFGMSQAASSLCASLHVAYAGEAGEIATPDVLGRIPMLGERMVGGLVLLGRFADEAVKSLGREFPCVRLVQHEPDVAMDCVNHDDLGAVSRLVKHLRHAGHRRIGFVTCDSIYERSYVQARFAGYVAALAEARMGYDPADCVGIDAVEPVETLVDRVRAGIARGVTAWVCVHDGLGYQLVRGLVDQGVRVPEDVALCGFDDFEPPAGLAKLTSMDAPFESMGMAAVHRLLHRIKHPATDPVQIMFPARLVEGATTRPA